MWFPRVVFFCGINVGLTLILLISLVIRNKLHAVCYPSAGTWVAILSVALLSTFLGIVMMWRLRGKDIDSPKNKRYLVLASTLFGSGVIWLIVSIIELTTRHSLIF